MPTSETSGSEVLSIEELRKIFSVLTHDLRSPLFAIDGFSTLLIDDIGKTLSEENRDFLERIRVSAKHMKQTIDGMNRIVKILTKPAQFEPTDLNDLVSQLWFRMRADAEENGVSVEIAKDLPSINVDREKISAALEVLLSNAMTFRKPNGDQARISLTARREGDEVHICVSDDGIGIEEGYFGQIFNPGIKLDREVGDGPGYGLFLARRIAEIHRGRIDVEAVPGAGSTFCLVVTAEEDSPQT